MNHQTGKEIFKAFLVLRGAVLPEPQLHELDIGAKRQQVIRQPQHSREKPTDLIMHLELLETMSG